ncbi:hypothetical protein ACHAWF_018453 [Thalassiosira exigua]
MPSKSPANGASNCEPTHTSQKAFLLQAVKDAMKTITTNNIFDFGSLHFLQLIGTVMVTAAAVMWATFYFR